MIVWQLLDQLISAIAACWENEILRSLLWKKTWNILIVKWMVKISKSQMGKFDHSLRCELLRKHLGEVGENEGEMQYRWSTGQQFCRRYTWSGRKQYCFVLEMHFITAENLYGIFHVQAGRPYKKLLNKYGSLVEFVYLYASNLYMQYCSKVIQFTDILGRSAANNPRK